MQTTARWWRVVALASVLAGCGGGGGSSSGPIQPPTPTTYKVGGTMSGLPAGSQATISLGANNLTIKTNGRFTYGVDVKDGDPYAVSIFDSDRNCIVHNGSGTVRGADVTSIEVDCHRALPWVTDGPVSASSLSPDGKTLYLTGAFKRIGPPSGTFVPVDPITGALGTVVSPVLGGDVTALQQDGFGGHYLAVTHRTIPPEGVERYTRLLHVDADGRIDPAFDGYTHGLIKAMALRGNVLYVGGAFNAVSGTYVSGLAALDTRTGKATSFRASTSVVYALALAGKTLYVGGAFGQLGDVPTNGVGAIDLDTAQVTPIDVIASTIIDSVVLSLAYSNGTLFIGGKFVTVTPQRINLAAIDPVNRSVKAFDAQATEFAAIHTIVSDGPVIYASGYFQTLGGAARAGLAALDIDTGLATPWEVQFIGGGEVRSIVRDGNTLYMGGTWLGIDGVARPSLAAVRADDGRLLPFAEGMLDGGSTRVSLSGGRLWVAGGFGLYGAAFRDGLAALDTETGELTPWKPYAGRVDAIQATENGVALGGVFTLVNGVPRTGFALVDPVYGDLLPLDPAFTGFTYVTSFAMDGSTLYVGGSFSSFAGLPRSNLAAIDRATLALKPWAPAASPVSALSFAAGRLFAGEGSSDIVAYEPGRSESPSWRRTLHNEPSNARPFVEQIAATTVTVYARRSYVQDSYLSVETIAFDAQTGSSLTDWSPGFSVTQMLVCDDGIYGVYFHRSSENYDSYTLHAIDKKSGARGAFVLTADGPIASMSCGADTLYSVGDFETMSFGGLPQSRQHVNFRGR